MKIFCQSGGPDWNLMIVTEYENTSAIEVADEKFQEHFEKLMPDQDKRKEIMKVTRSHALGHWDANTTEIPKPGT